MSGITDTISLSVTGDDGSQTLSGRLYANGSVRAKVDAIIPAGSIDLAIGLAFPFASLDTIQILADKNCILKFNDVSAPMPQINVVGGWPFVWNSGDGYFPNPFTADVTTVYVSAPGPTVNLRIKALAD